MPELSERSSRSSNSETIPVFKWKPTKAGTYASGSQRSKPCKNELVPSTCNLTFDFSDSALSRRPDELVHLKLETDIEFVSQNPFHNLAGIDSAEDR